VLGLVLRSFAAGGTAWRLAERVVQPYLPSEVRHEESASKIKQLKLFLHPGLLGVPTELPLFAMSRLFLPPSLLFYFLLFSFDYFYVFIFFDQPRDLAVRVSDN
jgi:hypothetical protein